MRMCVRCGSKGDMRMVEIKVRCGHTHGHGAFFDQDVHLCPPCSDTLLDQISVVISHEMWAGDRKPSNDK